MASRRRVIVSFAALLAVSCGRREAQEPTPVVTVDVAPVLLSNIQRTIRANGVLYPKQQAAIVPKISAPVKALRVQRGDRVRAGQLLVELENQDLAGTARESRASFDLAEATYETTSKATVPQELQKAELDARAAKDALDAQQAASEQAQSSERRSHRAEGRQRRTGRAEPGAQPVRNGQTATCRSAGVRARSGNQGCSRAARSGGRQERRGAGAARLLARHQSHRRRRDRLAALPWRDGSGRRAHRHGDGRVEGHRAHSHLAVGRH